MFTVKDRAALARRLRERSIPNSQEFISDWVSFNTLYNTLNVGSERDRLMNLIEQLIPALDAERILTCLTDPIAFFSQLPPGNMRLDTADPDFRRRCSEDLTIVNNTSVDSVKRLSHLMSVVYQVRCNLLHGDKDPDVQRDNDLVDRSKQVMNEVLPALISIMDH